MGASPFQSPPSTFSRTSSSFSSTSFSAYQHNINTPSTHHQHTNTPTHQHNINTPQHQHTVLFVQPDISGPEHLFPYLFIFQLHLLLRLSTQHQHTINTPSTQHQHTATSTHRPFRSTRHQWPRVWYKLHLFSHRLPVNQHLFLKNARLL